MRRFFVLLLILLLCAGLVPAAAESASPLYVQKVENLPDDFIFGMDVSSVLAEEASGVKYYDFDGQEKDLFAILAENGITHIRVRVWNDPFDAEGRVFGGGNCDIRAAAEIGRRAAAQGLKLIVDFHYSDFWADPGKQMVPRAWEGMDITGKTEAVHAYTLDCLTQLRDAGADIAMVQLGNETNGRLCGEKIWMNIAYLMDAGAKATREICPDALVALHFANPENADSYRTYAKKMDYYEQNGLIHYDVFATSYYPYWHGTLENLSSILTEIAEAYGKKVMVMETSYAYTPEDTDFSPNTIGEGSSVVRNYPYTPQGQANSLRDIVDTVVNHTPAGIGVCYWEGAWITVGTSSWEENREKWETYGSGWASSYAAVYDPDDAGKYYGGSAVDNQAFFDASGHPLESLKVFRLLREGNETVPAADALETAVVIQDISLPVSLPETVDAVLTDNSRQPLPVSWQVSAEELEAFRAQGTGTYAVRGEADGREALCLLTLENYNYLRDYSFEEGGAAWVFTDLSHADELYVEDKATDSLTGTKHAHFWSAAENSVEFTLEQTAEDLPAGKYRFEISIMGGDAGDYEAYAYARQGEKILGKAPMTITAFGQWDTGVLEDLDCDGNTPLTVGFYVRCQGAGSGAWGKIDDARLNRQ